LYLQWHTKISTFLKEHHNMVKSYIQMEENVEKYLNLVIVICDRYCKIEIE
ncbi:Hypothetical protein ORPV_487, partial [Orpheovirus IHUMI-LCC2]